MTSYADDNRFVLNSRKNTTVQVNTDFSRRKTEPTHSSAPAPMTGNTAKAKASAAVAEATFGDELRAAMKRYKKAAERRDQKRAFENGKVIRKALSAGTTKVSYRYEDYAVEEHNFPVSFAAIAVALTLITVFLLLNFSQITKFNNDISNLKSEMNQYNAEIAEYDILIGKKTDHASIEQYAQDNGLVSSDKVVSRYVTMSDNYKIEKTDGAASDDGYTVSTVMSGVVRLFGEALGD